MKMGWTDQATGAAKEVTAPLSLVVTAIAPVANIRKTWTPALQRPGDVGETILLLVDLAEGRKAMGGSAIAQVFSQIGNEAPDVAKYVVSQHFILIVLVVWYGMQDKDLKAITPSLA